MQLPPIPTSSGSWADKILWMLGGGGLVGSVVALVKLIFYRNKPKSEIAGIDAGTSDTQAATAIKLSNQLITLHDRMNLMEAAFDTHHRETAATIKFYQDEIKRKEEIEMVYRNRFHAVNSELGRLGLEIRQIEGCYSDLASKVESAEALTPVTIRTYDQIVAPFPFPPN